ncbi:MAG: SBBP repeat-containing protein [Planctomycetes bacterium]|nr:SBBP repeat-containing protein [Planctomycetota bacterium]
MKALGVAVGVVVLALGVAVGAQNRSPAGRSLLKAAMGKLPSCFIENRGVFPDEVAYYVLGVDKTLFFAADGITFRLRGHDRDWAVKLEFVGARRDVVPRGEDRQQAVFSYFKGSAKDWKTGLPTFAKVVYRDLWPGIDLVYRAGVGALKYEFAVAPGADPARIRLRYRGASVVEIAESGALRVATPAASFEDARPQAWQERGGERVPVETGYWLDPEGTGDGMAFGFEVGPHDRTRRLVLDPAVLLYSGFIGGQGYDRGYGVAVDQQGNAYVTGWTTSSETTFPVRLGPDLTFNDTPCTWLGDAFVAKISANGSALLYCGYIGGDLPDLGRGIAVDGAGNAYVTGQTVSTEQTFPATVGPDLTHNGLSDAFVAKVNASGTGLLYCGYVGGTGNDVGEDVAVDSQGNAHVVGTTDSTEASFPVLVGPDLTYNGGSFDAFVAKVNAAGGGLVYCGYIGGALQDGGGAPLVAETGIDLDEQGNAYVVGSTASDETTFPVVGGPDLTFNGRVDAFVAKVDRSGARLLYCGYIGGNADDWGQDVAVDLQGNAYVTGLTASNETTFPVRRGPVITFGGGTDAFVARVNAAGTGLDYCGYIGGAGKDQAFGIAVDHHGLAYVTGYTDSTEQTFPVVEGPDLTHNSPGNPLTFDAFVAAVSTGGAGLLYCGYIGGSSIDEGAGIAVDPAGNAFVTGYTSSTQTTFPVVVGPGLVSVGLEDTFVAKIGLTRLVVASGVPRPGSTITFSLIATSDAGLPYQVGSSFGLGPIALPGTRWIPLSADGLLQLSVGGTAAHIFGSYSGTLDMQGRGIATLQLPPWPLLIGLRIHTAFVTMSPAAPLGIQSISNPVSFSIVP